MVKFARRRGVRKSTRPLRRRAGRGGRKYGRSRQSVRRAKQGLPKRQHMQSSLGGLSITRFVASRRPTSQAMVIKKAGSPNFINITYPGRIVGSGGFQQHASWYLSCGNDLRKIWASIQGASVKTNLLTSAEYAYPTGQPTQTLNASFRYVLESATSLLYLTNTSGTPQNVELYDIVCKRDIPQVGLDMSGNVIKAGGNGQAGPLKSIVLDPSTAWAYGMDNETASATGFPSATFEVPGPQNLGATPYQSKLFKDYFKVLRKSNVSLPIGGQHKHFVDMKPNFIVDNDIMSQNNVYKGVSFFTLVVVSGVPVVACPGGGDADLRNELGDVSTSAANVSVIQQVKYKWTWVEDTRENVYRANYINNTTANAFTSIQPAMGFINNATNTQQNFTTDGTFTIQTNLPSDCKPSLDASGNAITDCGC